VEWLTVAKIIRLHQKMLCLLEQIQVSTQLSIKRKISEHYYLQTVRELELLSKHFDKAEQMLGREGVCTFYKEAYSQWRQDVRWVNRFLRQRPIL